MIFSFEAPQACHGDSLLLHAGTADEHKLVPIDGGPAKQASGRTYEVSFRDRTRCRCASTSPRPAHE